MELNKDESQYGNQKGISINHYLIKMVHTILTKLDKNSKISYLSNSQEDELLNWDAEKIRQNLNA